MEIHISDFKWATIDNQIILLEQEYRGTNSRFSFEDGHPNKFRNLYYQGDPIVGKISQGITYLFARSGVSEIIYDNGEVWIPLKFRISDPSEFKYEIITNNGYLDYIEHSERKYMVVVPMNNYYPSPVFLNLTFMGKLMWATEKEIIDDIEKSTNVNELLDIYVFNHNNNDYISHIIHAFVEKRATTTKAYLFPVHVQKFLFANGSDASAIIDGQGAFHLYVKRNLIDKEFFNNLVSYGAEINFPDALGRHPLDVALIQTIPNMGIVLQLIETGGKCSNYSNTYIDRVMWVLSFGCFTDMKSLSIVSFLIENGCRSIEFVRNPLYLEYLSKDVRRRWDRAWLLVTRYPRLRGVYQVVGNRDLFRYLCSFGY